MGASMIVYVTENIGKKRHGGSSLSGLDFLQLLRIEFTSVIVVTHGRFGNSESEFFGWLLNPIMKTVALRRSRQAGPRTFRSYVKLLIYAFIDFRKPKRIDLGRLAKTDEPNIIFVNSWSGIFMSNQLVNCDEFTKVCVVRGNPESFVWQSFEADKDEAVRNAAAYLDLFDELIFVSRQGQIGWQSHIGNQPTYYLPNSIAEEEVEAVRSIPEVSAKARVGFSEAQFNVVVIGSIQRRKGQDVLLEVIADVATAIPNIVVHLVGVISLVWGGKDIVDLINQSEYRGRFRIHGHSDDALLFDRAADLVLFTSRAEAFPRTVAEYMALGKPIIASNVSGVPEMITNRENGLLYDPESPSQLRDHILELHANRELAENLGINARKCYYDRFSKKHQILKAKRIFTSIRSAG